MNYKILMVDDDRELLKMLNQYFTLKNYTVMIAENGIEAMEICREWTELKCAEESEIWFPVRLFF